MKQKIAQAINVCRIYFGLQKPVIGGSAAMYLQRVNLRKDLHDIDIIVTEEQLMLIERAAKIWGLERLHGSSPSSHSAYKIGDLTLDFVVGNVYDTIPMYGVYVQSLNTIFKTKKKWARPKDIRDCNWIVRGINQHYNTRLYWNDIDEIHVHGDNVHVTCMGEEFIL